MDPVLGYFEKKKKWRVKKHTKVVESATTEQLLDSIKNVNNIYDFQFASRPLSGGP